MSQPKSMFSPARLLMVVVLPIVAVLIAGVALYVALIRGPAAAEQKEQTDLLLRLTGISQSVVNKLDEAYVDVDGDLLADVPADAAKLLDPAVLRFSYIATDEPETYEAAFKEFCDHVAKVTGKKVEYALMRSAEEELRGVRDGTLHVAGFNTGNVPRAVNVSGFIPVAATATAEGDAFIRSLIIAPTSSPVKKLTDLKGCELTLTDTSSNSGYRVPLAMLKANGLLPARDFGLRYSSGHDQSIARVAGGTADAAAVASDILAREVSMGLIKKDQFIVLTESEKFPAGTIGYAHNLKPELAAAIRNAILTFDWKGSGLETSLGAGGAAKFIAINFKDDFALVRKIDNDTGNPHKLDR